MSALADTNFDQGACFGGRDDRHLLSELAPVLLPDLPGEHSSALVDRVHQMVIGRRMLIAELACSAERHYMWKGPATGTHADNPRRVTS